MKAYKCDICGKLFEDNPVPFLQIHSSRQLEIMFTESHSYSINADICPDCLKVLNDTVRMLSPEEENDEPETSSSEC